jgi:topoisomerase-4 subunit A
MGVSEILEFHSHHLVEVLKAELELEKGHLLDRLHARTMERIFIEERIYKRIELKKSADEVNKAVVSGFKPFSEQLLRPIVDEDVERLLKIPIRRISLFDIEKNRQEIEGINSQLQEIEKKLANLVAYALEYIQELKKMLGTELHKRKTTVKSFETIAIKEVAERNLAFKYDQTNGYLGYGVKTGNQILEVSTFDRVLIIRKDGTYQVMDAPEKEFVGKGMLYCGFADKSELAKVTFTVLYQEKTYKYLFLKRCQIASYTLKKVYPLVPEGNFKLVKLSTLQNAEMTVTYKPKPGLRILEEKFYFSDYLVKGVKANGVRVVVKDIASIRLRGVKEVIHENDSEPTLFDEEKEE